MPDRGVSSRWSVLARWVSIVGHPFVCTLALVAATESRHAGVWAAARLTAVVAILFVLPLAALTVRQVRRGAWGTVDASHPRERPLLYMVGGAALLALLGYFAYAHPGTPLVAATAAVLGMVVLCAVVTPWLKVSLHMAAAALAATVLLGRGIGLGWVFVAALPLLGWSRVALGRHQWREVVAGLAVGASTGAFIARLG